MAFADNSILQYESSLPRDALRHLRQLLRTDLVIGVPSHRNGRTVPEVVDAILEGRTSVAQGLYHRLLADGVAPSHLLVMISRQVRIIYQMKEMRKQNKPRQEIAAALGLNLEFLLNKAWAQAEKYSLERLKEIYHRLLDTDLAIKTGQYDGELALTILIAEMGPAASAR